MRKSILPFPQVPQLSKTDIAYATSDERLLPFYTYPPTLDAFEQILLEKERIEYPRADLVDALSRQYKNLPTQEKVSQNIEALGHENAFTIVTAHQPSLFLGPLYFVYKALTAINLAEAVEARTGGKRRIVPVFVLGSEDHDIEEVNKVNLFGKQIVWNPGETGPVGSMGTESLAPVLDELRAILGNSDAARALFKRVENCCREQKTFAEATQALLHEFFGQYGMLVLNMNDAALKRHFIPIIRAELTEPPAFRIVNETIGQLSELGFKTQAAPREINLFYLMPGKRERILPPSGGGWGGLPSTQYRPCFYRKRNPRRSRSPSRTVQPERGAAPAFSGNHFAQSCLRRGWGRVGLLAGKEIAVPPFWGTISHARAAAFGAVA